MRRKTGLSNRRAIGSMPKDDRERSVLNSPLYIDDRAGGKAAAASLKPTTPKSYSTAHGDIGAFPACS